MLEKYFNFFYKSFINLIKIYKGEAYLIKKIKLIKCIIIKCIV